MWKKISIQLILLSTVMFSIFFVYNVYFKVKDNTKIDQSNFDINDKTNFDINDKTNFDINDKTNTNIVNESNLVKNLKYLSKDSLGNEYIIESEYSELNLDNIDVINMKNVSAKVIMINSKPIYITSNFATYNNESYETTFTGNVLIIYFDSKIRCEKFYISIENNFANVTDNVIYENSKGKLIADTIEIDLITKNSKIFMNDKNKKVTVLNK